MRQGRGRAQGICHDPGHKTVPAAAPEVVCSLQKSVSDLVCFLYEAVSHQTGSGKDVGMRPDGSFSQGVRTGPAAVRH